VEIVRFGYAGREYEIDLYEQQAATLNEALATYVEHARGIDKPQPRQARSSDGERRSPEELRAIREQGLQVSDRGRIAADIVAKYDWPTDARPIPAWAILFTPHPPAASPKRNLCSRSRPVKGGRV
jgi:hypothetical protein